MSKVVLVCLRNPARTPEFEAKLRRLESRILPEDITPNPARIVAGDDILTAVYNPVAQVRMKGGSVCPGIMLNPADDWGQPGADVPDGGYALFRADEQRVELVTDMLASRSVWYAQTDELFAASTSQRAIVALLGDFQMNDAVLPWMLTTGMLGLGNSWDKRIHKLPGDSRLLLDRRTWQVRVSSAPLEFTPSSLSEDEQREHFKATLRTVFEQLSVDYSKCALFLSGGGDSRTVCLFLPLRLPCITFGLRRALDERQSDAAIARRIAEKIGAPFRYFPLDPSEVVSPEESIWRFLAASEGRIDRLSFYTDGLTYARWLFEEGVENVFQGDVSFGTGDKGATEFEIRKRLSLLLLSDVSNLPDYRRFELPEQTPDGNFFRRPGESLVDYGQRMHQQYRYPLRLSNLNDARAGYVEMITPLVMHPVVRAMRALSPGLRHRKRILYDILDEFHLNIPYAEHESVMAHGHFMQMPSVVPLLRAELQTQTTKMLFSERLIEFALEHLEVRVPSGRSRRRKSPRRAFFERMPRWIARPFAPRTATIPYNLLAWRMVIVSAMHRMLTGDAGALKD